MLAEWTSAVDTSKYLIGHASMMLPIAATHKPTHNAKASTAGIFAQRLPGRIPLERELTYYARHVDQSPTQRTHGSMPALSSRVESRTRVHFAQLKTSWIAAIPSGGGLGAMNA